MCNLATQIDLQFFYLQNAFKCCITNGASSIIRAPPHASSERFNYKHVLVTFVSKAIVRPLVVRVATLCGLCRIISIICL